MKWLLILAALICSPVFGSSMTAPDSAKAAVMFRIVILPPVEETQLNAPRANVPKGQGRVQTTRADGVKVHTIVSP